MKRTLSPMLLLIALTSGLQAQTCVVDGVFVPPEGHPVFGVIVALSDTPSDTKFEKVNGSTDFRVAFSLPASGEKIEVKFTPELQGFDPAIKTFYRNDIVNNGMLAHAGKFSWYPARTSQAAAYNAVLSNTQARVAAEEHRESRGNQGQPQPSVTPVPERYHADDVNLVYAYAKTGNQIIDAAQLKIRALLVRHYPTEAFKVFSETVEDNRFYKADRSRQLQFLAQWFKNIQAAAEHRGAHVDTRTGILLTSLPPNAVGLRKEFHNLTEALARVDRTYTRKVRSQLSGQVTDQARLAAEERAVRDCLAHWLRAAPGQQQHRSSRRR